MKTALLLVTCIALFFTGGMANAFPTCPMNMDKASAEMQMDADMDMPCHETKDSEDQSSDQCNGDYIHNLIFSVKKLLGIS